MKKFIFSCLLLLFVQKWSGAQFHYDIKNKNYYQIVADAEIYFSNQETLYGREFLEHEGSEYNEFQKWKDFWEPRLAPHGSFEDYLKAYETVITGGSRANSDNWTELGPFDTDGQSFSSNGGTQAGVGPIEFLQFYEPNPNMMICGSMYGGIFYTLDAGVTWRKGGSDSWHYAGCMSAAIHPTNFTTWYGVSQFGGSGNNALVGFVGGIWKTTSMGSSWTQIATPSSLNIDFYTQIFKILLSPTNPSKAMVATSEGLRYTNDINASPVVWFSPATLNGTNVFDVEINLNNPNHFFATRSDGSGQWSLMESLDGGATWTAVANQPSTVGASHMTIETTRANQNILYTLTDMNNPGCISTGGGCSLTSPIWKYTINTQTWASSETGFGHVTHGWGHGFGISQTNQDEMYLSYADRYQSLIANMWTYYTDAFSNKVEYHVDIEDFVCHPTNDGEVWMADHGGLHKSTDYGVTWVSRTNGLAVSNVTKASTSYTNPNQVLIGAFHDGNKLTTDIYSGDPWATVYTGDGQFPMIDYSEEANMWLSSGGGFQYCTNYGTSCFSASVQATWNKWAIQHVTNPSTIYAPNTSGNIVRSLSNGSFGSYQVISNFATTPAPGFGNAFIREMAMAPSNSNYLYASVRQEVSGSPAIFHVYRTTDANNPVASAIHSTWQEVTTPNPNAWIKEILVDYEDPNIVYLVYSSKVSGTYNFLDGTTMVFKMDYSLPPSNPNHSVDLTLNLPNVGVSSAVMEKGTDGGIYIATDIGVYFLNNKRIADGTNWYKLGELPHVTGSSLEINYVANKIRIGTFGRGVWEHDLFCPEQNNVTISGVHSDGNFYEMMSSITSTAVVNNGIETDYRAGYQITLLPGFRANAGCDFNAFIHKCDSPGNSFKDLEESEPTDNYNTLDVANVVEVYPNPTNAQITVQVMNGEEINERSKIILFTMLGEQLQQFTVVNEKTVIDLSEYNSGIYLLVFTNGVTTQSVRISKTN